MLADLRALHRAADTTLDLGPFVCAVEAGEWRGEVVESPKGGRVVMVTAFASVAHSSAKCRRPQHI